MSRKKTMKYDYEKSFDAFPYEKYEGLSIGELDKLAEEEFKKNEKLKEWPKTNRF